MESDNVIYFEEIIIESGTLLSMIVIKGSDCFQLFGLSDKSLYLYVLPEDFVSFGSLKGKNIQHEVFKVKHSVITVFSSNDKIYVLDECGKVFEVYYEAASNEQSHICEDSDLFDDSPKDEAKWKLKPKYQICDGHRVVAACTTSRGLIVLANINSVLNIKLFEFNEFKEVLSILLEDNSSQVGLALSVPFIDVGNYFLKHWLSEVEDCNGLTDVVFVSTSNGLVYYCPVGGEATGRIICMYQSVLQIVNLFWKKGEFSELQLVLKNGALIKLHSSGEKAMHLPVSNVGGIYITEDIAVVSDYTDCYKVELDSNTKCALMPHKGLITFCEIPGHPKMILSSTLHKSVYQINIDVAILSSSSPSLSMLQESDFNKLLQSLDQLDELNAEIQSEEEFHKALSLTLRAPLVAKHVTTSVKVVQILGPHHVLRIKASLDVPGIVFPKNMWKMSVTIFRRNGTYSKIQNITNDVDHKSPLMELVNVELPNFDDDLKVKCKLMCQSGRCEHWLMIPIGEVLLNASFFLQPVSMASASETPFETSESLMKDILQNPGWDRSLYTCSLPLGPDVPLDTVLPKVLNNSRALWRASDWKEIGKLREISVFFFGCSVTLFVKNNSLEILSENIDICHFIKSAAIVILVENNAVVDCDILVDLQNILHSLELLNLEQAKEEELKDLFQKLRTNISSKFST